VKCWGLNIKGQIGDRTANQRPSPTLTQPALSNVTVMIAGAEHNCALDKVMNLKCWGDNAHGKLGDNTVQNRFTPTPAVLP
jgi:alpha-tubulin suppressor-like RCC1 family protein